LKGVSDSEEAALLMVARSGNEPGSTNEPFTACNVSDSGVAVGTWKRVAGCDSDDSRSSAANKEDGEAELIAGSSVSAGVSNAAILLLFVLAFFRPDFLLADT